MHQVASSSSEQYERARQTVATFLGAAADEIVFTRGATESLNLLAQGLASSIEAGEGLVVTRLEHHSNILPWQRLCMSRGAHLHWLEVEASTGNLDLVQLRALLASGGVRLVAVTGLSNVLGIMPQVAEVIRLAHEAGAWVVVDAAQLVAHAPIDVRALDCDALVLSGHKLYGPTGIGVLYARRDLLRQLEPWQVGGGMVQTVTETSFTPLAAPAGLEAGTPPIAEAVGLAAAIHWLSQIGWGALLAHEASLMTALEEAVRSLGHVQVLGPKLSSHRRGCLSFTADDVHPHDLSQLLGDQGVCVRAGHHCAQPLHAALGVTGSVRASVCVGTTQEDVETFRRITADVLLHWRRRLA
jgi:SufS family cysteine desulfurase